MQRFSEKIILNIKRVFWFPLQILYEIFLILRSIQQDIVINFYWSSGKVPLILVRLQKFLNILDSFSQDTQISSFMKICPVEAELFHTDGRTDIAKLMVTSRNFANAPIICGWLFRTKSICNRFERKHRNIVSKWAQCLHLDGQTALPVSVDRRTTLLRNVGKNMPKDTTPHPTRRILKSSIVLVSVAYIQDMSALIQYICSKCEVRWF
jgi:hypothetical protein